MTILKQYLIKSFIKYFLVILLSLEIFFVGIDFLQNNAFLPSSANLQLLYVFYTAIFTLSVTLPLSMIFAWIVTIVVMVQNNELISLYSLGISKQMILKPIILVSIGITIIFMISQATPLAYSYENKKKILSDEYFINEQSDIFLKYNNYFVYFKKLYPIEKKATDIHIFKIEKNDVVEIIVAKKAYFQNNKWYTIDNKIIKKPHSLDWENGKLEVSYEKFLYTLEGFEPKIINNVYKATVQFSILDAIRTILLLNNQDFDTNKIKTILYTQTIMPFFTIPLMVIIFLYSSPSSRFFNKILFISISSFATLILWGLLFLLQKLALGGIIFAELGILLPVFVMFMLMRYIYIKKVSI